MRLAVPFTALVLLAGTAVPALAQTAPTATAATPAPNTPAQATPAQAAPAQTTGRHHARRAYVPLETRFQAANTTHDGHLTQDQARSAELMHTVAENFDSIDKAHRGYITEDDIRAWYKERRDARHHAAQQAGSKS